jgi:integrase/recombinase XerC
MSAGPASTPPDSALATGAAGGIAAADAPAAKQQWAARYLEQLASLRQLSPHTVSAYRRDLAELASLSGATAWDALSHYDIRRLTARLHAQGQGARTIARKLSGWRGFFEWLSQQCPLAANPVDGVRAPKRPKTLPKALSVDDAVHLVSTSAHPHATPEPAELCNYAMFELMYSSGLRVSELAGLDASYQKAGSGRDGGERQAASLGWLDLDAMEVVVTGKGNKMRRVPIGTHALQALQAWLVVRPAPRDGSAALFVSGRATRITPRVVQLRLKQHGAQVGTAVNVHPHVLRHSFASHVLQSSGDLRAVQEMLGHASITSTQVYTALDFQHLSEVYDKAHPRAKSKT